MRNIKLEQNLANDEHWPNMSTVKVTASATASSFDPDIKAPELEEVIQSWHEIAVLRVTPKVDFYFGFAIGEQMQFLNSPIETENDTFGVHIGNSDVTYFVFATDMKTRLKLELSDRVSIDDPKYKTLPLY